MQEATRGGCHRTRRYESVEGTRSPARCVQVCPQQRLYTAYMFTDDPIWVVVAGGRTLRALKEWRPLTDSMGALDGHPRQTLPGLLAGPRGWISSSCRPSA